MLDKTLLPAVFALLCSSGLVASAPLDETWYQPRDSPVASLFHKRYTPSPSDANFTSNYPAGSSTPPSSSLPASWLAKLASITMPNVSVSQPNNGYPQYPGGESGADQTICSFTYACTTEDDLYNPPAGVVALSFDDGPTPASIELYDYLIANNVSDKATHFMIGSNVMYNPTQFQAALDNGGHIAVHTWSHPYMTSLTNEQVLGELGWTMQVISDLNGGRLPKFWRPPFGDVDNRVRAIAKGVFGLETVVWNQDSGDWAIGHDPQYTNSSVNAMMSGWLTGSKSPGLLILEHEVNPNDIGVFMTNYPLMMSNGWSVKTVADAFSMDWYQNSADNKASVTTMSVGSGQLASNSSSSTSASASSSASTSVSSSASGSTSMTSTSSSSGTQASTSASSAAQGAANTGAAGVRYTLESCLWVGMAGLVGALLL